MKVYWLNSIDNFKRNSLVLEISDFDQYDLVPEISMIKFIQNDLSKEHEYYKILEELIMSKNIDNLKIAFEIIKTI